MASACTTGLVQTQGIDRSEPSPDTAPSSGGWLTSVTDQVKKHVSATYSLLTPLLLLRYPIMKTDPSEPVEEKPVDDTEQEIFYEPVDSIRLTPTEQEKFFESVERQESQEDASDDVEPTEEERQEYLDFKNQIEKADFKIHANPFYSPDAEKGGKTIQEQVQEPCRICLGKFEEPKPKFEEPEPKYGFGTVFKWSQKLFREQVLNDTVSETPLKTPVKLNSCSHVVCHGCVENLIGHGSLSCPMCRTPTITYSEVNEDYTVKTLKIPFGDPYGLWSVPPKFNIKSIDPYGLWLLRTVSGQVASESVAPGQVDDKILYF